MKFISSSNEYIINHYLNQLSLNYNCLHFKKINDIIDEINNNPFINKNLKDKIFKEYKLNIALKHFVDMCYHKTFFLNKPPANDTLLSLEAIDDIDKDQLINLYIEKKHYVFSLDELVSVFNEALEMRDDVIPDPVTPKNPYTNKKFNPFHLSYIYEKLRIKLIKLNKEIPINLYLYKKCQFNVNLFYKKYKTYFIELSCKNYVLDHTEEEFEDLLDNFLFDYELENQICLKCLKEIDDYKLVMTNILAEYVYENNFFKKNKQSLKIFLTVSRNNNLLNKKNKVCLKHRIIYRPKRSFNRPFNFSLPTNMNENIGYQFNTNSASGFNFCEGININNFIFTANTPSET
jgi:hypothetical protein